MPFHIEISAGIHRARAFNLDRDDLLEKVVEPWLAERTIELGDREWAPRDSELKILEGARLEPPDLSFGQGWANAERASRNVTGAVLAAAPPPVLPDAFVIEADLPEATLAEMLAERGAQPITWRGAWERLDGRAPQIAAVVLVVKRKP
jgi:hypothetical protein